MFKETGECMKSQRLTFKKARDENEAIDQFNIIEGRTRGATKKASTYAELDDEEGLSGPNDGISAVRRWEMGSNSSSFRTVAWCLQAVAHRDMLLLD